MKMFVFILKNIAVKFAYSHTLLIKLKIDSLLTTSADKKKKQVKNDLKSE